MKGLSLTKAGAVGALAIASFVYAPDAVNAQTYNSYGSSAGYGNYGNYSSYGGYGGYGYGAGYGGYGGYGTGYGTRVLYRSPASVSGSRSDDRYHTNVPTNHTKSSAQRFKKERQSTRNSKNYYSNKTYNANHPYDSDYYGRSPR